MHSNAVGGGSVVVVVVVVVVIESVLLGAVAVVVDDPDDDGGDAAELDAVEGSASELQELNAVTRTANHSARRSWSLTPPAKHLAVDRRRHDASVPNPRRAMLTESGRKGAFREIWTLSYTRGHAAFGSCSAAPPPNGWDRCLDLRARSVGLRR